MTHPAPQPPAPQAPAASPSVPAVPALQVPSSGRVIATGPGPNGTTRVYTPADIAALYARKNELGNQLNSAHGRRKEVQSELRNVTTPADRAGLEQRLGVLDARIARIEQDIDENSGQLASQAAQQAIAIANPGHYWSPSGTNPRDDQMPTGAAVSMGFLAAMVIGVSSRFFRRGRSASAPPAADTTQRLERMEQAMEAIAVEIERVSEGQRFVTRLMSEARPNQLGTGRPAMEPVPLAQQQVVERR